MKILLNSKAINLSVLQRNREVLWGWKRDSGTQQRIILFGASIDVNSANNILLKDWFLFYRNRSQADEIHRVFGQLNCEEITRQIGEPKIRICPKTRLSIVELSGGPALIKQQVLIQRLLNRRPRKHIPTGSFPIPTESPLKLHNLGPIAAYIGSGVSYESGLPTLATVHETFGVDQIGDINFTFGAKDPIPLQLAKSVSKTFNKFINFHLLSAIAEPSFSHHQLAQLYNRGLLTRILTDNVDNLFSKIDIPFTRTRGIGIFNDKFEIKFDRNEKTLLVMGVAADRRSIISQARKQGLRIIVVNPEEMVSPRSQNLSYLRSKDLWYRMTAKTFFEHFIYE